MDSINYNLYDTIVAETIAQISKQIKDTDKIVINYNNNITRRPYSQYILRIAFIVSDITNKPIYIKGNILTYLRLKVKYSKTRKIYYEYSGNNNYIINPESCVLTTIMQPGIKERTERPLIVEEIYNTYYA